LILSSSSEEVVLTEEQKYALRLFYKEADTKIIIAKPERDSIWKNFVLNRSMDIIQSIEDVVPAFYAEVKKAIKAKKNLQPAVFSECVYSQALAEKFDLSNFSNHLTGTKFQIDHFFPDSTKLDEFSIRYSYSHSSNNRKLIQAGGGGSVDCALICEDDEEIVRIELKEPYARTSEPDLPKYGENGLLVTSEKFTRKYPQFTRMLNEHLSSGFNVFEHLGNNVGTFKEENIESAVRENYTGDKYADVICTEDSSGYLVMLPANHVSSWARLEGEIRPTGRNHYKVWTPMKLQNTLDGIGAIEDDGLTEVDVSKLKTSKARGSSNISRYKINSLFFVRAADIVINGDKARFKKNLVRQLRPSITAKMDFKGLEVSDVRKYYEKFL